MNKIISKNKNLILLVLILIFALVIRLIFFSGVWSSDSLFYSEFADMLSKGDTSFIGKNHFAQRLGIIFPTSILYSIFGVNEFSSNIWVLLISLGSIVLIYKFGKLFFSEKVGLLSAFLLSFFPLEVVYSTTLMGDLPSIFFLALSVYLFLKSEKINKKISSDVLCFFSGLSLGISYLIREMSVLIGLFFLIYVIYNKKIKSRYFLIALGFILMFSIEFLYLLSATGNPFLRYSVTISEEVAILTESPYYARGSFPFSLAHYPYIIFTHKLLGLFYPFIFIAIFYCIVYRKKETYNLLFWFIPLLLYISFGSASLTTYTLIPPDPRLLAIITFPGILVLSFFLAQDQPLIKRILMPTIVTLLIITSLGYIYNSEFRSALDPQRSVYGYLKTLPEKDIYVDGSTKQTFNYFSGYKNQDNIIRFNHYNFLKPENTYSLNLSQVKESYIVISRDVINYRLSSKKGIKYPKEIFDVPENWILKKETGTPGKDKIEIYYVP